MAGLEVTYGRRQYFSSERLMAFSNAAASISRPLIQTAALNLKRESQPLPDTPLQLQ